MTPTIPDLHLCPHSGGMAFTSLHTLQLFYILYYNLYFYYWFTF